MTRMDGRVVLATGATDGIGKQTALELAGLGATVVVHGRTEASARRTAAELRQAVPGARVEAAAADLAHLEQVRALARDMDQRFPALHVLLNNAGVYVPQQENSADGLELTLAINHFAHYLLTRLLLPKLQASAPSRVITVSSGAHARGRLDWEHVEGRRPAAGYAAYATSKLCNVLFTQELARRLEGTGVTANALHPGVISTKLLHAGFGGSGGAPVADGARTSVYLASSPDVEEVSGRYFVDGRVARAAWDAAAAEKLWQLSARSVGLPA